MICVNMRHSINGEFRPLPPWNGLIWMHQQSAFDWKIVFQKKTANFSQKKAGTKTWQLYLSCTSSHKTIHPTNSPPETGNLKGQGRRIVLMDLMDGMPQAFPPGFLEVHQNYITWKADGATPMYWFIMAPYKSPPNLGVALSLQCTPPPRITVTTRSMKHF